MRRDRPSAGHSLVELVVALSLLALLGTIAVGLLAAELRTVRQATAATEAGNAIRFTARLLRSEMRPLVAARDFHGLGADSSSQRVFRGAGIVCSVSGTAVEIRYLGMRNPDPAKDSVLALTSAGEFAQAVLAAGLPATSGCTARGLEIVLVLTLAGPVRPGDVVLLFETGTWHLSNAALRYARGAGGRQPVTATVFVDDSTHIAPDASAAGTLAVRLDLAALPSGSTSLAAILSESHRLALLNLAMPLDSVVMR